MYREPKHIISSYNKNNIGKNIYDLVRKLKPEVVIEFGMLYGYSTVCIAQALRDNGFGKLKSFDLFEDYEYKNGVKEIVYHNLDFYNLTRYVELEWGDYYEFIENGDSNWDLAHIDISNTGKTLKPFLKRFANKSILFEGGSEERDNENWMKLYNHMPIRELQKYYSIEIVNEDWPSLAGVNL